MNASYSEALTRIAFGGMKGLPKNFNCVYARSDGQFCSGAHLFDLKNFSLVFSSTSCLKWSSNQVCQKASYFCLIDGELILIEQPASFEEALKDCVVRNGSLSKFSSSYVQAVLYFMIGTPQPRESISHLRSQDIFWTDLYRGKNYV